MLLAVAGLMASAGSASAQIGFSRSDFDVGGDRPTSVAVGDFNADGVPDLAVANDLDGTVSVLLGTAGGGFAPATTFPVAPALADTSLSYEPAVAVGDFNGDSDPDLAVTSADTLTVLLGAAGGSFTTGTAYAVGGFPGAVVVADFNNDGNPDLAIANQAFDASLPGYVSVLVGAKDGSFTAGDTFPTGAGPFSMAVGDFNGDGDPDLAVANANDDTVSVLLGTTGAGFHEAAVLPVGRLPISVAVGDFNADGDPDLAVAIEAAHNVSVLLAAPGGNFAPPVSFDVGGPPTSLAVGDFNGDGDADLAVTVDRFPQGVVAVLPGRRAGGFATPREFPVGNPVSVAVGDFNRDSKLDLVVADELEASVSVLLNTRPPTVRLDRSAVTFGAQSSGTFSPAQTLTITNTGDTPLQISDVRTTTGNADDFVLGGDTCTASPIAATQSCTLGVRFRPSEAGLRRTTLRITSDDPAGFHDVALAGTASVIVAGPPGPRGPRGGRGHRGRRGPAPRVSRVGCKVARRQPARHKVRVRCRVTLNGTRDVRVRTLTVPHAARLSRAGGPGARARTAL